MKAKIGDIEIEGTPDEIKEYLEGQRKDKGKDSLRARVRSFGFKPDFESLLLGLIDCGDDKSLSQVRDCLKPEAVKPVFKRFKPQKESEPESVGANKESLGKPTKIKPSVIPVVRNHSTIRFRGNLRRRLYMAKLERAVRYAHKEGLSYNASGKIVLGRGISGDELKSMRGLAYRLGFKPSEVAHSLKAKSIRKAQVVKPEPKPQPSEPVVVKKVCDDLRSKRMRFIRSRVKTLIGFNQNLSYEEAFVRASAEWIDGGFGKVSTPKPVFPVFKSVNPDYMPILEGVVKQVVNTRGCLDFRSTSYTLDIKNYFDWEAFCLEFMRLAGAVSDFLNVPNKWKINRLGKYNSIVYGGA